MIKLFENFNNIEQINKPVIAVGNFDGVHRGHQELIKAVLEESKKIDGSPAILTFYPHPLTIINPYMKIEQITPLADKVDIFEKLGIGYVYVLKFDDSFSSLSAENFITEILVEKIAVKKIVIGYNFRFGANKTGDVELLRQFGEKYSFEVIVVSPYKDQDIIISSTKIRGLIKEGNIRMANNFLGRAYSIKGIVIKGRKIGRMLGFPTANLLVTDYLIPRKGVYVAYAYLGEERLKAVVSIGPSPTFHIDSPSFEVHILDFDRDIYGKELRVEFVERLRGIEKFDSVEALKLQIKEDINKAEAVLL